MKRTLFVFGLIAACTNVMAESPGTYRLILGGGQTAAQGQATALGVKKASVSEASTSAAPVVASPDYAYVRQSRTVQFDTSLLSLSSPLVAGDVIVLDLMSNVTYTVVINSVSRDAFGSLSILGTIEGASLSTVIITANNGAVIGTIQDMEKGKLFRIRCIGAERTQEVLDYEVEKMPARIDLPPLIAPIPEGRKD